MYLLCVADPRAPANTRDLLTSQCKHLAILCMDICVRACVCLLLSVSTCACIDVSGCDCVCFCKISVTSWLAVRLAGPYVQ